MEIMGTRGGYNWRVVRALESVVEKDTETEAEEKRVGAEEGNKTRE